MAAWEQTFQFCNRKLPIFLKSVGKSSINCRLFGSTNTSYFNDAKKPCKNSVQVSSPASKCKCIAFCKPTLSLATGSLRAFSTERCLLLSLPISPGSFVDGKSNDTSRANGLPEMIIRPVDSSKNSQFVTIRPKYPPSSVWSICTTSKTKIGATANFCNSVLLRQLWKTPVNSCLKVKVREYTTVTFSMSGTGSGIGSNDWTTPNDGLLGRSNINLQVPRRHKARSKPDKVKKDDTAEEDDEDTDEDQDDDDSDSDTEAVDEYLPEDRKFSPSFKDVSTHIRSLRVDAVVGAGLNISRSKVEDQFLGSKIRLNGQKLLKKGVKMGPGDIADLVMTNNDGKTEVKRVRLIAVSGDKTKKDRYKTKIRAWRSPVIIDS